MSFQVKTVLSVLTCLFHFFNLQVSETKIKACDHLELAKIAFQQFVRAEPYPGQIVANFKIFLFDKFSVSDMHADPKRWSSFLQDS